jgi:uncharacterized protein YbjT (DUF2867 family)
MTTLVLCGTGKAGHRVVERLAARGLPVRVGSRSGDPPFDWEDRATWAPALQAVDAAFVSYHPDLVVPWAADAIRSFAQVAVERDVRRLVMLSRRGERRALLAEQAVRECGAEWTIVRASWFDQNFSEGYLLEPVLSGEVALPARQVGEPFVDADDVADVAAAALTEDRHAGRVYEVTGPRLLTFAEAVEELAEAAGREIRYARVTMERYAPLLAEHGVPVEFAWVLTHLFVEVLDGRTAYLADGVQRALGREPRDFADYARDAAATGVWRTARRSRGSADRC